MVAIPGGRHRPGIDPDAEVFTKAPVLSAAGAGAAIGIRRLVQEQPGPEVVLAADGQARSRGATPGNDVNLRGVEGRNSTREASRDPEEPVAQPSAPVTGIPTG